MVNFDSEIEVINKIKQIINGKSGRKINGEKGVTKREKNLTLKSKRLRAPCSNNLEKLK